MGGGVLSRGPVGGAALTDAAFRRSGLAQAAATRGPWKWAGKGPVLFYRGGRVYTPWGNGRWSLSGEAIAVTLGPCGTFRLTFNKARTAFSASSGHGEPTSHGVLDDADAKGDAAASTSDGQDTSQDTKDTGKDDDDDDYDDEGATAVAAAAAKWRRTSHARIYKRLLGSGPWSWQGVAPLAFLGGNVLHTPWGKGSWQVPVKGAGENVIEASFVGQKHMVTFDECWGFSSVRASDGDKASGVAKIDPPPKADACPKL